MHQHFSIPKLFSRVARHLTSLAFWKLQVGIFKSLCCSSIESLSFACLKAAENLHCQRILANAIYLGVSQREPKFKIAFRFCFLRSVTNRLLGLKRHASMRAYLLCNPWRRPEGSRALGTRMSKAHGKIWWIYLKRRP